MLARSFPLPHPVPILLALAAAVAGAGCGRPTVSEEELSRAVLVHPNAAEWREAARPAKPAGACATLRDTVPPDVLLQTTRNGEDLVLFAAAPVGLVVVDVSNPDEPLVVATAPFAGTPLGVFELEGAAAVVYAPWDRPAETAIRTVSLERRRIGEPKGELVLDGAPRDARRVGDVLVVTREVESLAGGAPHTVINTFTLDPRLAQVAGVRVDGNGAVAGATPWGIAIARTADPSRGPDRTAVTWFEVDEAGALTERGTVIVNGVLPRWRRAPEHPIDVTEDGRVRLIGCLAAGCTPGTPATYAAIDFEDPTQPRIVHWATLARAADGTFGFDANRLLVARPPLTDAAEATELAIFATERGLEPLGTIRLRGIVSSLDARESGIVALGWTGSASAGKRAILHHVEGRRFPRLVGSVAFGGDWTWSPAYDDERAISYDPSSTLAALPMTTVRGTRGATPAAQVLNLSPAGPRALYERPVSAAERLLFVDGRLLAFSSEGVSVVGFPGERRVQRRWDDVRTVR